MCGGYPTISANMDFATFVSTVKLGASGATEPANVRFAMFRSKLGASGVTEPANMWFAMFRSKLGASGATEPANMGFATFQSKPLGASSVTEPANMRFAKFRSKPGASGVTEPANMGFATFHSSRVPAVRPSPQTWGLPPFGPSRVPAVQPSPQTWGLPPFGPSRVPVEALCKGFMNHLGLCKTAQKWSPKWSFLSPASARGPAYDVGKWATPQIFRFRRRRMGHPTSEIGWGTPPHFSENMGHPTLCGIPSPKPYL
ncbi:hypothetical protein K438DRAFT_1755966 [Mycena galopus ATCC 62051]|nr:hypothetical protein K438DRAFT_1755966 [Mycena galopus ATCC 62051]